MRAWSWTAVGFTVTTIDGTKTIRATAHHSFNSATDAKWSKPPDSRRAENGRTTIQAPRHYTANLRIDGAPDSSAKISFNLDGIDDAVASAPNGRAVDPSSYDHLTD